MITPKEARALNELDEKRVTAEEVRIDAALRRFDGRPIQVDMDREGVTGKVIEEIERRYAAAGWKVSRNYGDKLEPAFWLTFTEA